MLQLFRENWKDPGPDEEVDPRAVNGAPLYFIIGAFIVLALGTAGVCFILVLAKGG